MKKEWNIPARMPEYGEISVFWIQLQTPEGQKNPPEGKLCRRQQVLSYP